MCREKQSRSVVGQQYAAKSSPAHGPSTCVPSSADVWPPRAGSVFLHHRRIDRDDNDRRGNNNDRSLMLFFAPMAEDPTPTGRPRYQANPNQQGVDLCWYRALVVVVNASLLHFSMCSYSCLMMRSLILIPDVPRHRLYALYYESWRRRKLHSSSFFPENEF